MLSVDEINELERKYKINVKQYDELLKQYNAVLKLSKENADANEYCLQELEIKIENLSIDNDKLKDEVLNLRGQNIQYELALKTIRKAVKDNLQLGVILPSGWIEQKIDEVLDD